jgi:hypothetical protein
MEANLIALLLKDTGGSEKFRECISRKISVFRGVGMEQEQAVAAAHGYCEKKGFKDDEVICVRKVQKVLGDFTKSLSDIVSPVLPTLRESANLEKPSRLRGVLKVPITIAAEMVQTYHISELSFLRDFLPESVKTVRVFKPYEELADAASRAQGLALPFVIPHTNQTFIKDQIPLTMQDRITDFIPEERVLGVVKHLREDIVNRKIKGTLYIPIKRMEDLHPGLIADIEKGHVVDVSIGFLSGFGEGGVFVNKDGTSQEYLLHQKNITYGHVAGLLHARGKCPSGICGVNQDKYNPEIIAKDISDSLTQGPRLIKVYNDPTAKVPTIASEGIVSQTIIDDLKAAMAMGTIVPKGGLKSTSDNTQSSSKVDTKSQKPIEEKLMAPTPEQLAVLLSDAQKQISAQQDKITKLESTLTENADAKLKKTELELGLTKKALEKANEEKSVLKKQVESKDKELSQFLTDKKSELLEYFDKLGIKEIDLPTGVKAIADLDLDMLQFAKAVQSTINDAAVKNGQSGFPVPDQKERDKKKAGQQQEPSEFTSMNVDSNFQYEEGSQ